ncbi:translocation/assembly module TamB domain-containing protein, partial [Bacteroidota bacterium]
FNIHFKNTEKLSLVFFPDLIIESDTRISGNYNSSTMDCSIDFNSPQIIYKGKILKNTDFNYRSEMNSGIITGGITSLTLNDNLSLENVELNSSLRNDSVILSINWDNHEAIKYSGVINAFVEISRNDNNSSKISISMPESEIYYSDTLWTISESLVMIDSSYIGINNFSISNDKQSFRVNGAISRNLTDTLFFDFNGFDMNNINPIFKMGKIKFGGVINGNARIFDYYTNPLFYSDAYIDKLVLNGENLGNTIIKSDWDSQNKQVHIKSVSRNDSVNTLNIDGYIDPEMQKLAFDIGIEDLSLEIFIPFLQKIFPDIGGVATGDLKLEGDFNNPKLNGFVNLENAYLFVDFLKTKYDIAYNLNEKPYNLELRDNDFILEEVELTDIEGNKAMANGIIKNDRFKNFTLDINIGVNDFLCMDTKLYDNKDFFGKVYMTGNAIISGPDNEISLNIDAKTEKNTRFIVLLNSGKKVKENDFIKFVNTELIDDEELEISIDENISNITPPGLELNFDLEVTPDAQIELWSDLNVGDVLKGYGSGNLILNLDKTGEFKIFGDYVFEKGDYFFTMESVLNKDFKINYGSTIYWDGNPASAQIDIDAQYDVRTNLYDFLLDDSKEDYKKRILIECHLMMTDSLLKPNIKFEIRLPTTIDDYARSQFENLSEPELLRQVIALLVMNRFIHMEGGNIMTDLNPSSYSGAGISTATSLITSQLTAMLSRMSNDFDLGVNYRTGDELTNDEMEVALSTQLLDNRVSVNINGNVDMGGANNPARNSIVGDFDVEFKPKNNKGKLKFKAYSHTNQNLIYDTAPNTQGLGVFYREEFSSIKELAKKYWQKIFKKKPVSNK